LQARLDAILQRLQCPPPKDAGGTIRQLPQGPTPKGYGDEEFSEDWIQLDSFTRKREAGIALSTEEDAEEAHRMARFDCYREGPEQTARRRRRHLEDADNLFRKNRFLKVGRTTPLSRKERNDLWLLRWLYPPLHSKSHHSAEAEAETEANIANDRPFGDKKPAADGNFYPHDSKLRPARFYKIETIDDGEVEIPPYYICNSGQPPYFTYELPTNSTSDKSGPSKLDDRSCKKSGIGRAAVQ
jgi:hypothetical protein